MSQARDVGFPLDRLLASWLEMPVAACEVRGLCLDSRKARPGDLFFAVAGSRGHGMAFAPQAVAFGAVAVLYDPAQGGAALAESANLAVPCLPLARLDQTLGFIADRFFGEPSAGMTVLGITGTNGKTSCSHFLAQALGGAVIGTLGWGAPGALRATTHTTPDAIEIHALLSRLAADNVGSVAMEASSHGLDQGRLHGVRFAGGLFTNLSRDHLDYHLSMEAYLEAKLRLVAWPGLEFMAFNLDDTSATAVLRHAPAGLRKIGFTLSETVADQVGLEVVRASSVMHGQDGIAFEVSCADGKAQVAAPLYGDFNVENLLGVFAVLRGLGFGPEEAARRLRQVRAVPGRMERFASPQGAVAVVDYAHTPDALSKALVSLRRHCRGKLSVVFGCGGDRDRGKRPQMGAVAAQWADHVVLTDDNPRSEDGDAIIEEILAGCGREDVITLRDRRAAIAAALERLAPDDVLLVAGKGHEDTQDIGGVKHPFSDRLVVRQLWGLTE